MSQKHGLLNRWKSDPERIRLNLEQHKINASLEERKIDLELRRLDLQISTDRRRRDTEARGSSDEPRHTDDASVDHAPAAAVGRRGRKRQRRSTSRELLPPETDDAPVIPDAGAMVSLPSSEDVSDAVVVVPQPILVAPPAFVRWDATAFLDLAPPAAPVDAMMVWPT